MKIVHKDSIHAVETELVTSLADFLRNNSEAPILFFYSGGSAMNLYQMLYERIKNVRFSELLFAPVDERNNLQASNYEEFKRCDCYEQYLKMNVNFLHCGELGGRVENVAKKYNEIIVEMFDYVRARSGKIVAVLGMGADGHTAGIFGYPENKQFFDANFLQTESLVCGYDLGVKNEFKERITLTIPALEKHDAGFAYVTGEKKREALMRAVSTQTAVEETPAAVWQRIKNCTVFTDISL